MSCKASEEKFREVCNENATACWIGKSKSQVIKMITNAVKYITAGFYSSKLTNVFLSLVRKDISMLYYNYLALFIHNITIQIINAERSFDSIKHVERKTKSVAIASPSLKLVVFV